MEYITISQDDVDDLNKDGFITFPCMCGCDKLIKIQVYERMKPLLRC